MQLYDSSNVIYSGTSYTETWENYDTESRMQDFRSTLIHICLTQVSSATTNVLSV